MANQTFNITVPDIEFGPAKFWYNLQAPFDGQRMLVDANGNPQNPSASQWTASIKNKAIPLGQEFFDGTNIEICIAAGTAGNGVEPVWPAVGSTIVDGSVTWQNLGVPLGMGAAEGAATFHAEAKIDEIIADQETAAISAVMTAELAYIDLTLKESSLRKIAYGLAHATYSSGTDTGLPAGAQTYEQIDVGGLTPAGGIVADVFPCVGLIAPRRNLTGSATNKYLVAALYSAVPKNPYSVGFTRTKELLFKVRFDGIAQLWRTQKKRVAQFYRQT